MAVKPILFNAEMVRAILDGRKCCTRRVIKQDVEAILNSPYHMKHPEVEDRQIISKLCQPPYQVGDVLYVRETWQHLCELDGNEQTIEGTERYYYAATDALPSGKYIDHKGVSHDNIPWKPSIRMPKKVARIWLKVTDVRVERLQDMTDDDAEAEGCSDYTSTALGFPDVWDSTIKKSDLGRYSWVANPWVWVIEFERCEKPKEGSEC